MAIYVYETATGKLHSWCPNDTDPVADAQTLAANGFTAVSGLPALDLTYAWQTSPPGVITVTAPVAPINIATGTWLLRFTPQEFAGIMASTDPIVQQFIYALNHTLQIDLADSTVVNAVGYLATYPVNAPLLLSSRVAAILGAP